MRWIPTLTLCFVTAAVGVTARADKEIAVAPTVVSPGQSATLTWFFGGVKLTITGGQYLTPTVITGKQTLKVSPKKTTKYVFDLYYHPDATAQNPAAGTGKMIHVQYNAVVEVLAGTLPSLAAYKGSHGWRVGYQTDWKAMQNRPGSDDLVYFQPEEDAVERLAVAVVPVKNPSASRLMDDVRADIPSNYTHYTLLSETNATHQGLPAIITVFEGNSAAHPNTRTTSMMMAVVNGDQGYVISARTDAARFKLRQPVLTKMLDSFVLTGKITSPPPAEAKPDAPTDTKTTTQAATGTGSLTLEAKPNSGGTPANTAAPSGKPASNNSKPATGSVKPAPSGKPAAPAPSPAAPKSE